MPSRVTRLSVGFARTKGRLGLSPGSSELRGVLATVAAIGAAEVLPGHSDFETKFGSGRAHVRRVPGRNLWVLYRFDDAFVDVLTLRDDPPIPTDEE